MICFCHSEVAEMSSRVQMHNQADELLCRAFILQSDELGIEHELVLRSLVLHASVMIRLDRLNQAEHVIRAVSTIRLI